MAFICKEFLRLFSLGFSNEYICLVFSNYSMNLDTNWSLVKSPEATQYPGLKSACDITGKEAP